MLLLSGLHFSKTFNTTHKKFYFQSPQTYPGLGDKVSEFAGEPALNYTLCFLGYRPETASHPVKTLCPFNGEFSGQQNPLLIKELRLQQTPSVSYNSPA